MKKLLVVLALLLIPTICFSQQISISPTYLTDYVNGIKLGTRGTVEGKVSYIYQGLFSSYQVRLNNTGFNALEWQRIEAGVDPLFLFSAYTPRTTSKYLLFYNLDLVTSPYGASNHYNGGGFTFTAFLKPTHIIDLTVSAYERSGYLVGAKFGLVKEPVFATIGVRQQRFGFSDDVALLDKDGKQTGMETRISNEVINSFAIELGFIF